MVHIGVDRAPADLPGGGVGLVGGGWISRGGGLGQDSPPCTEY